MKFQVCQRSTPSPPPLAKKSRYFDLVSALIEAHARGKDVVVLVTLDAEGPWNSAGVAAHLSQRTRRFGGPFRLRTRRVNPRQVELWIEEPDNITPEEVQAVHDRGATRNYRRSDAVLIAR